MRKILWCGSRWIGDGGRECFKDQVGIVSVFNCESFTELIEF